MIVINNRTDMPLRILRIWRGISEKNIEHNFVCGDIEVANMDEQPHKIVFSLKQCSLPFEFLYKVIEAYNPDTERFYKEV